MDKIIENDDLEGFIKMYNGNVDNGQELYWRSTYHGTKIASYLSDRVRMDYRLFRRDMVGNYPGRIRKHLENETLDDYPKCLAVTIEHLCWYIPEPQRREIFEDLISYGDTPGIRDGMMMAIVDSIPDVNSYEYSCDPDDQEDNFTRTVDMCFDYLGCLDYVDPRTGASPLVTAVKENCPRAAEYLLKLHANPRFVDENGDNLIRALVRDEWAPIRKYLE